MMATSGFSTRPTIANRPRIELAEWRDELATVLTAMRTLPRSRREALMRRAHGAAFRDVLTGRSAERARQLVAKARAKLRQTLAGELRRAAA